MTTGRPHGRSRLGSDGKDASIGGRLPLRVTVLSRDRAMTGGAATITRHLRG